MTTQPHLEALKLAGWDDLTKHEQGWVTRRLSSAASRLGQEVLLKTHNPGGLRSNRYGNAGTIVDFAWPDVGHAALVDAARRAAFQIGAAVPPDIPLQRLGDHYEPGAPDLLEEADSGDLPSRIAAGMAMEGAVRDLRQQWEAFDRIRVGRAILPAMQPKAEAWRRFRDAWDRGELGEDEEPGWHVRVGGQIRELVEGTNEILRAGVWGKDSPERKRIDKIREVLLAYRGKIETASWRVGFAPEGSDCPWCGISSGSNHPTLCPNYGELLARQPTSVIEDLVALEQDLDRLSEPVWHAPGELGALALRVGLVVGELAVGALFDSGEAERIASLRARIETHDRSVAEAWNLIHGDEPYPPEMGKRSDEPEFRDYIDRWVAFKPLSKIEGDIIFHWSGDLEAAELKFNNFLKEFDDLLELRRAISQEKADVAVVQAVLDDIEYVKRGGERYSRATAAQYARAEELRKQGKYQIPIVDLQSKATPAATLPPAPPLIDFEKIWTSIPIGAKAVGGAILAVLGLSALASLRRSFGH